MRLLHYAPHLFLVSLAVATITTWLPDGLWKWAAVALMAVATVGVAVDMFHHRGRLCELCAANVPLNGGVLADRYRATFRGWHWMTARWWRYPAVMVGVMVVLFPLPSPVGVTIIYVLIAAWVWVAEQHTRLRPWCPYCQWGGGGDEEQSPATPPTPSTSK